MGGNKKATWCQVADVQVFVAPALLPVKHLSSEGFIGMIWTASGL
jgi:hypothetical protein